jgi:DNA topoisomerase-6 subunit B
MKLERTTFELSRELEFFDAKELEMQIGQPVEWWPVAILKELIDNALDACECAGVAPEIRVGVKGDALTVEDNGPGIPPETVRGSLDYLKRVSDKLFYVSPTRGQLGNALKVVWAAPFVESGKSGRVEVSARGVKHTIEVSLDRIRQAPAIGYATCEDGRQVGTSFRVEWPELASILSCEKEPYFYYPPPLSLPELVEGFAALNPHATFRLGKRKYPASDPAWQKWRPDLPTSPHWYTPHTLRDLIAAYVGRDQETGQARSVRAFVSEFRGLSSTAKQKAVANGLSGVHLRDLVDDGDIAMPHVEKLLAAMKGESRPVPPAALGVIGKEHLTRWMETFAGVNPESVRYSRRAGEESGQPYVVEVAFGIRGDTDKRRLVLGLNWTPALGEAVPALRQVLSQMRIDPHDPVTVIVHLARPRFAFTGHGKGEIAL